MTFDLYHVCQVGRAHDWLGWAFIRTVRLLPGGKTERGRDMGVPAFFRWLSRKYPSIVVHCVEEKVPAGVGRDVCSNIGLAIIHMYITRTLVHYMLCIKLCCIT